PAVDRRRLGASLLVAGPALGPDRRPPALRPARRGPWARRPAADRAGGALLPQRHHGSDDHLRRLGRRRVAPRAPGRHADDRRADRARELVSRSLGCNSSATLASTPTSPPAARRSHRVAPRASAARSATARSAPTTTRAAPAGCC